MKDNIVEFRGANIEAEAVLKAFDKQTNNLLFETSLGPNLLRRAGYQAVAINRDVRVQYEYLHRHSTEVESYIYLDNIPTIGFPIGRVSKGTTIQFSINRDTVLTEGTRERVETGVASVKRLSKREALVGALLATLVGIGIFAIIMRAIN